MNVNNSALSLPGERFMNHFPCKGEVVMEACIVMVPPSAWVSADNSEQSSSSVPHWTNSVNKKQAFAVISQ